jgi:hypothetical protein
VVLAGCGGTACVTFVFNPGGGTIHVTAGNPPPPCVFPVMTSPVRIASIRVPSCIGCPRAGQAQHIYVTLRGIDVRSDPEVGDMDWLPLAPQLESKPLHIDLLESTKDPRMKALSENTASVPAGVYHQLRVRFAPDPVSPMDVQPSEGSCGQRSNCVVMEDERIVPLFSGESRIEADMGTTLNPSGFLVFAAGGETTLAIDFALSWQAASSVEEGIRLHPSLTAEAFVESRQPALGAKQ